MRLPSELTRAMINHLGTTYFQQIWNSPDDHGRANFPLPKASKRLHTGNVPVGLSVVGLPTTDKVYAVYRVAVQAFGRFTNFPEYEWVTDNNVLQSKHVQISTYTASGRLIPEGSVCFRYDPLRSQVLIAIDRTYTSKCAGEAYPQLYMTVFFDTTRKTPTVSQLFKVSSAVTPAMVTQALTNALAQYPYGTMVYVNGWAYASDEMPALFRDDVVQITSDPDVIGYCELSIDDNVTGYYSERYKEYREVLHIPKILNPNNVTITIDTLTMVVFDPVTGKGVYGHQLDDHAVESITHNDFSVSRRNMQSFQNALQSQGVAVRLYVRYPTDPQTLEEEVNHLKSLYVLDDAEIKLQLVGLSSHQISEWKASLLETSPYLDLLYNFDQVGSTDLLTRYMSAVGYYDVADTLAESMHYYTYKGAQVTISKPARLINVPCQAIVYADGRKLPAHTIGLGNTGCTIRLGFQKDSWVSIGTRIGVFITEAGTHDTVLYKPTADVPTIKVDNDDYQLVKLISYDSPVPVVDGTASIGYRPIQVSPGDYSTTINLDGTVTYKVSAIHYGATFYLIPICGLTTLQYDLDDFLISKSSVIIPLTTTDSEGKNIPLISWGKMEVYINGYRLIEGIDYTCNPVRGVQNDVLQTILSVSNQEYFDQSTSGNILEVVIHGDRVAAEDKGYVIDNKLYRNNPPMVWTPSSGRAFVRGRLVEDVTENGTTLITGSDVMDGSPYLTEWTIPYGVSKLLHDFDPVSDENLRTRIYRVLQIIPPVYPSMVTISDQYALYSTYLARIVSDVTLGAFVIVDEAKDDAFLRQFDKYKLIYERDLILAEVNPLLDRRFVTLAAHYVNRAVTNPQQMVLVQRLINLTLLPVQLAIDEVLI